MKIDSLPQLEEGSNLQNTKVRIGNLLKNYEEITFQQVSEVAKKYLTLEKRSTFVIQAKDDAVNVKLEPAKEETK